MSSTTSNIPSIAVFQCLVWRNYKVRGRHALPWRKTRDPYRILVSEMMLQQTQVTRVIPKYRDFLQSFPTAKKLAEAPLKDVLLLWQGLGYNRRAKYLHETAKIVTRNNGKFPRSFVDLCRLPGIGAYTAGAILAFCYDTQVSIIETNIRTVFLHHFFPHIKNVSDADILTRVTATLPREGVREWYYALMDYGAYLKQQFPNPNRRSKHHARQSKFVGSDRQLRGAIIRLLSHREATQITIANELPDFTSVRIRAQLVALVEEGLVVKVGRRFSLPT